MNIYDLLDKLATESTMTQGDKTDAADLLAQLRRLNSFGTIAHITSGIHEYTEYTEVPIVDRRYATPGRCGYCGKLAHEHETPNHIPERIRL